MIPRGADDPALYEQARTEAQAEREAQEGIAAVGGIVFGFLLATAMYAVVGLLVLLAVAVL